MNDEKREYTEEENEVMLNLAKEIGVSVTQQIKLDEKGYELIKKVEIDCPLELNASNLTPIFVNRGISTCIKSNCFGSDEKDIVVDRFAAICIQVTPIPSICVVTPIGNYVNFIQDALDQVMLKLPLDQAKEIIDSLVKGINDTMADREKDESDAKKEATPS